MERRKVHHLDPESGTDGQVPIISGGKFVVGDPTAPTLDGLTDVTAPTPGTGQALAFNGTVWVPTTLAGGGGATTLDGLTDVDTATTPPTNGQTLVFNSASGLWKPGAAAAGGAGRPLVDPTVLTWTWINQGVATIATQGASLLMASPAEAADNWHFRAKAVPAKPYSVIIHQLAGNYPIAYSGVSVGWLQSSNNRFANFGQRGPGNWAESSYSVTNYVVTNNYNGVESPKWDWIKLTDDATNRRVYVSRDGYNWTLFHSVATNNQITPDRLIFGLESRSAWPCSLTIDSWEEGA